MLKSYLVTVRDAQSTSSYSQHEYSYVYHRMVRHHYVVGTSSESAVRQARRIAGYTTPGRSGVIKVQILEAFK